MGLILAVIGVQMLIGGVSGAIEMAKQAARPASQSRQPGLRIKFDIWSYTVVHVPGCNSQGIKPDSSW